jgi:uncharacterized protein YqgV (UPF0045/DUF77 family)
MKITVEISFYPLQEDFKKIIKSFIKKIDSYDDIDLVYNNISTQFTGKYERVFEVLQNEIKPVFEKHKAVFVCKFLSGDKLK